MDYLIYRLSEQQPDEAEAAALLNEQEKQAYAERGREYLLTRSLLKRELSRRTGIPAADIRFRISEHGKPEWETQPFNLSHSGDLLCLAFHHLPIGVDVQQIRPLHRLRRTAERIMSTELAEQFRDSSEPEIFFFRAWCVAEALVKWAGATVWDAPRFPFVFRTPNEVTPLFPEAPVIRLFTPAPGYCAAVVYTEEGRSNRQD